MCLHCTSATCCAVTALQIMATQKAGVLVRLPAWLENYVVAFVENPKISNQSLQVELEMKQLRYSIRNVGIYVIR